MTNLSMETIRQRFEERFKPTPFGVFRDGKIWHPEYAPLTHENVQAFIAQELTLLAEECYTIEEPNKGSLQRDNVIYNSGFRCGLSEVAAIIRAHAKELI